MSTGDHKHERVQQILWEALRLSGEARSAYLAEVCAGDASLHEEVRSLVEAEEKAGTFLRAESLGPDSTLASAEKTGDRIGRYKLLEQIGEGGFGVVWMAEQEEPVRRRVALKIIKLGMDTKEVVARFEAERQALAMMDHPHIARVFDGGATATGRPYFVMELVKGLPITDYCDLNQFNTRQRLELFVPVCEAVQHAHLKGVIHRDLKPSNVLVTIVDDKPLPKVIDFGVAKATQARLTEKTLFTRFQQWVGTPAYMSPEQAGLGSLQIDTRTDVYSLGVLLYELLTSKTPFDTRKLLEAGYEAVLRTIREQEPPKPSTRLSTLSSHELDQVARQRQASSAKLESLFQGELDWMVMKALEKDRQRRYQSAKDLGSDLHRYLTNKPITAAPPTPWYRLQKFALRHKLALGLGAAFVIAYLLLNVMVGMAITALRAPPAGVTLSAVFQNVGGLSPPDPVFFQGKKIGCVERISFDPDRGATVVKLRVFNAYAAEIRTDSRLSIEWHKEEISGGERVAFGLMVHPGTPDAPRAPPETVLLVEEQNVSGATTNATSAAANTAGGQQELEFMHYRDQLAVACKQLQAGNLTGAQEALQRCDARLRNWEWHYANRQCHPAGHTIQTAPRSADEQVSYGGPGTEPGTYAQLTVDPGGSSFYVVAQQSGAAIFDAGTGTPLHAVDCKPTGGVFSPGGKWFVQAAGATNGVRIVEVSTGKCVAELPGTERPKRPGMQAKIGIQFDDRRCSGGVVLNADGSLVAAHTTNGVSLFGVPDGALRAELKFSNTWAAPIEFHPGNASLLVGCAGPYDETALRLIRIADQQELLSLSRTNTQKALRSIGVGNMDDGSGEPVGSRFRVFELACFSSSGDLLALASAEAGGAGGQVEVWDVQTASLQARFSLGFLPASMTFAPSGSLLVSGFSESQRGGLFGEARASVGPDFIVIHPARTELSCQLKLDAGGRNSSREHLFNGWGGPALDIGEIFGGLDCALSPDGRIAAVGAMDQMVHLVDLEKCVELTSLRGHSNGVIKVAFDRDERLYSLDTKGEVRVWDLSSWLTAPSIAPDTPTWSQSAAAANVCACSGRGLPGPQIKVVNFDERTVKSLTNCPGYPVRLEGNGMDFVLSPSGTAVATIETHDEKRPAPSSLEDWKQRKPASVEASFVVLRDIRTGQELKRFKAEAGEFVQAGFSLDGSRLGAIRKPVANRAGELLMWNLSGDSPRPLRVQVKNLQNRMEMLNPCSPLGSTVFALSPDGYRVAAAVDENVILCLAIAPSGETHELFRTSGSPPLVFSPKGDTLLTGASDKRWRLLDAGSGKVLKELPDVASSGTGSIEFAPDGKRIILSDSTRASVWNLATGKREVDAPCSSRAVSLSPDGKRLALANAEEQLELWDVAAAAPAATFPLKLSWVRFSRTGQQLFGISPEGKLVVLEGTP